MKGKSGFIILAVVCLLQAAAPLSMIISREVTLRCGHLYRFEAQPVDPYDPFRGKFVRLGFASTSLPIPSDSEVWQEGGNRVPIYAMLGTNDQGFAILTSVSLEPPATGDYLRIKGWRRHGTQLDVRLPLDRYYMNEELAPEAERVYRKHAREADLAAYAMVRVRRGRAVIEGLNVEDMPIEEFVMHPPVPE